MRLYGPDLNVLRAKGHELEASIAGIEGVSDVKVQQQVLMPQIEIRIRTDAAARLGLSSGAVRDRVARRGRTVGQVYDAHMSFDVVVWGCSSRATM